MTDHAQLCDALCHVLGNTCRLNRTTKSYEWNVRGRGALLAEACFRDQAAELHESLEPLARHILGLGSEAILDYSDGVVVVNPPTAADVPTVSQMIQSLTNGHEQAIHSIGAAMDLAHDVDEQPTACMLSGCISAHRDHRRRLALLASSL